MANILLSAVVTLVGLWMVFVDGNLGLLAILAAFGGAIWLLYSVIRHATRPHAQ